MAVARGCIRLGFLEPPDPRESSGRVSAAGEEETWWLPRKDGKIRAEWDLLAKQTALGHAPSAVQGPTLWHPTKRGKRRRKAESLSRGS